MTEPITRRRMVASEAFGRLVLSREGSAKAQGADARAGRDTLTEWRDPLSNRLTRRITPAELPDLGLDHHLRAFSNSSITTMRQRQRHRRNAKSRGGSAS